MSLQQITFNFTVEAMVTKKKTAKILISNISSTVVLLDEAFCLFASNNQFTGDLINGRIDREVATARYTS